MEIYIKSLDFKQAKNKKKHLYVQKILPIVDKISDYLSKSIPSQSYISFSQNWISF